MDAFDAAVLICAAVPDHQLGRRVRALFPTEATSKSGAVAGIGSVLLVPELLTEPIRDGADTELEARTALLGRIDLRPVDEAIAELATVLGSSYRLRAADALHLATAVAAGADRFITNNARTSPRPSPRSPSPTPRAARALTADRRSSPARTRLGLAAP